MNRDALFGLQQGITLKEFHEGICAPQDWHAIHDTATPSLERLVAYCPPHTARCEAGIPWKEIRENLPGRPANAQLLERLLWNPHETPSTFQDFEGFEIWFPGTRYVLPSFDGEIIDGVPDPDSPGMFKREPTGTPTITPRGEVIRTLLHAHRRSTWSIQPMDGLLLFPGRRQRIALWV